jgi:hypothetical protein
MKKILKTIGRGISLLFKLGCLTVLLAVLIPVLYFAWRINQPMDLPEFNGLTYVQFAQWRKMVRNEMSEAEQKKHPERVYDTKSGCLKTDLGIDATMVIPSVAVLYIAQTYPENTKSWEPDALAAIPAGRTTLFNFLPHLWSVEERKILMVYRGGAHVAVGGGEYVMIRDGSDWKEVRAVCKLKLPPIPTPEEFEAMKSERELAAQNP